MPTPYLFFDGRAQEAIDFYQRALGAQVQMLDSPLISGWRAHLEGLSI